LRPPNAAHIRGRFTPRTAVSAAVLMTVFLAVGWLPASAAAAATPSPPTQVAVDPSDGQVHLSWRAPGNTGSSPLLQYDVFVTQSNTDGQTFAGPPRAVTVPATQTSATVTNLAEDCYTTYSFSVAGVNADGVGHASHPTKPELTSGYPPGSPPPLAVIELDGAPSAESGGSFYPLKVSSPAKGIGTVSNYCPATAQNKKNSFPAGLQDSVWRWSEFSTATASLGSTTSGNACLDTNVPSDCLTAGLAGADHAVLLPFSYTSGKLNHTAAGDVFNMQSYGGCDSAGGVGCASGTAVPDTQRKTLDAEITSIHRLWPSTRIALVGHSYGGMLAEQWWLLYRPTYPDHDGVVAVYSLDSPINGVRNALAAFTFSPEIQNLWYDLWNNLFTNASNDGQILSQDADGSYLAVGTPDDDYAFGATANGPNPPITSQLDFNVSGGNLYETPVDYQSPCSAHAAIAGTVYQHDTPKVCPQVVKLIARALAGAVPPGSCAPSSSLIVMVNGSNVTSYVPKGNWAGQSSATGVSAVNVEGSSITPTRIPTASAVNSCAPNPLTGETVCTANNTDVYLINGTSLTKTLTSAGSGTIGFSGGDCTDCGVAMDAVHNRALLGLSVGGTPGFQLLDLSTDTFSSAFRSGSSQISEDPLIDPTRNLLLSASEDGNYEIIDVSDPAHPVFYENNTGVSRLDSAAEDCSTGIALAPAEFSDPSSLYITDLTQATFTRGSPTGTWTAPSQSQSLSESSLSAGPTGIAVAQGTHTGMVTGEFGGDALTALTLPTSSGSGTPAVRDWVTCTIGNTPDGNPWSEGDDPHTVAAYQSPNGADAIGLLGNQRASWLARVDLTKLLDPSIVPRDGAGHACASGTIPASAVSFIPVP
jgi:Fibronectin type III domain